MGLPLIRYSPRGSGVRPMIHFYCVLHAKREGGGPDSMENVIAINGRPLRRVGMPLVVPRTKLMLRAFESLVVTVRTNREDMTPQW